MRASSMKVSVVGVELATGRSEERKAVDGLGFGR